MSKTRRQIDWEDEDSSEYFDQKQSKKLEKFKPAKESQRPIDREDYYRRERYQDDDR